MAAQLRSLWNKVWLASQTPTMTCIRNPGGELKVEFKIGDMGMSGGTMREGRGLHSPQVHKCMQPTHTHTAIRPAQ